MKKYSAVFGLIISVAISVLIFVYRGNLSSLQAYGFLGLFLLNVLGSATIFLPTPLFLTAYVAGTIYNPFIVAVVASLGSTIGELTGYIAGYGAEELLINDNKVQKVKKWMDKYGLWTLLVLAAIPNPLFDIAGIVSGATGIPVYKFLSVVWVGKLIKFAVIVFLGIGTLRVIGAFN